MMSQFRLPALAAALAVCAPCFVLPLVAAAGAGSGLAVLQGRLGVAVAVPVALFATGVVLFAVARGRRHSCEVTR